MVNFKKSTRLAFLVSVVWIGFWFLGANDLVGWHALRMSNSNEQEVILYNIAGGLLGIWTIKFVLGFVIDKNYEKGK